MKAKKFDCVEMMHRGAKKVQEQIGRMTKEEEMAFWRERSQNLARQAMIQKETKHELAPPQS